MLIEFLPSVTQVLIIGIGGVELALAPYLSTDILCNYCLLFMYFICFSNLGCKRQLHARIRRAVRVGDPVSRVALEASGGDRRHAQRLLRRQSSHRTGLYSSQFPTFDYLLYRLTGGRAGSTYGLRGLQPRAPGLQGPPQIPLKIPERYRSRYTPKKVAPSTINRYLRRSKQYLCFRDSSRCGETCSVARARSSPPRDWPPL